MAKKKNPNTNPNAIPGVKAAAPKKPAARKPKAKAAAGIDSQMKKTILSAPQALKLEAAHSFMRTTAFTLQNKVRTAMTGLSRIEKSEKTPSARLGLSFDSTIQPTSSNSFFAKPFNRFKIAFLAVVVIGGISGYFYSDKVIDGFKSMGDAVSNVSHEKNWVEGMMTQTNGIPEGNDKSGTLMPPRMMEETVVPAAEEAPAPAATTDVLPKEAAPVAKVVEPAKPSKASPKAAKKGKATKTKSAKGKGKSKSKVAHK